MEPKKSTLMVLSHCLLNPSSRLEGIKCPSGINVKNTNVIQLPCPELIFFGRNRREITKDQLDNSYYRRFCHDLFVPFADMIEELYAKGMDITIIGVRKSPSCAVEYTTTGGPAGKVSDFTHLHVKGKGVFVEEIEKELLERGVSFTTCEH
jgi:predicted secreted protein